MVEGEPAVGIELYVWPRLDFLREVVSCNPENPRVRKPNNSDEGVPILGEYKTARRGTLILFGSHTVNSPEASNYKCPVLRLASL